MACTLAGAGAQPGARGRATPGPGTPPDEADALDLEAISELVLSCRGIAVTSREAVIGQRAAWAGHRTRRVQSRTATKNQLLGQLDRAFPGLTLVLPDVLGTKVGRPVAVEFADPGRHAGAGAGPFILFHRADRRG